MNARSNAALDAGSRRLPAERRATSTAFAGRDASSRSPTRHGVDDSAPLLQARHAPRRQLPRVHGRDQGRARARAVLLPHARRRAWKCRATARAPLHSQKMIVELLRVRHAGAGLQARLRARAVAAQRSASASRASPRARAARGRTCRIRRWRSTSTPASSARAACARAARSRSTT